jgi:hypothetical protein
MLEPIISRNLSIVSLSIVDIGALLDLVMGFNMTLLSHLTMYLPVNPPQAMEKIMDLALQSTQSEIKLTLDLEQGAVVPLRHRLLERVTHLKILAGSLSIWSEATVLTIV